MSKDSEQWLTNQPKGKFSLLPHAVSRSDFLDSSEKNVWCYLSTHSKGFHPSEAMIARNTGIKEKAVRAIIDRLVKKNVIEITNLPRRPGKKKEYRLVKPDHWLMEAVSKTAISVEEQVTETASSDQEPVQETWENKSTRPDIENQKGNQAGEENQQLRKEESLAFIRDAVEIITKSRDIESITLHLSSLIKNYTALHGESPAELRWLLNKLIWWSDQMKLNYLQREELTWNLIGASASGVAVHESKSE